MPSGRRSTRRLIGSVVATAGVVAGLLVVPLAGTSAAAGLDTTMYGVASTALFTFNPTTGAQTALPTPTSFATAALARQPGSTRLYYYAQNPDGGGTYAAAYYDLADNTNHTLPGSVPVYFPRLAFRPDGTLVGMTQTNTLYTLDPTTGSSLTNTPIAGLPSAGGDIAFDASNNMWVVANSTVYKVPAGTAAVSGPTIALPGASARAGAAFGPGGHLYVTDTQNPSVLYDVDVVALSVTTVGASGSATVSDLASETNRPPTSGPAVTTSTAYATPIAIPGLTGAVDPDGDPLTVAAVSGAPAHGTTSISGGTITYTPATGWSGTDTLTWSISDGLGGEVANTATVSVAKPPPAFTGATTNDAQTVQPGSTPAAVAAANPTGGTETYAVTSGSLPPGVTLGSDGSFTGTVAAAGVWTATITATDSGGSATTTLTITVPNVAPTFTAAPANSSQQLILHGPSAAPLAATDANGDSVSYAVTSGTLPAGLVLAPDGTFSGSPTDSGTTTVQVTVTDSHGGSTTHPLVLDIRNAPDPTAPARTATTPAGTPTTVDLLAGATDPSSYALTVSATGAPASGSLSLSGGQVTYTPDPGFSGDDTFTYTLDNGHGGTATAAVSVTVTPTAAPVSTSTPADTATDLDVLTPAGGTFSPAATSVTVTTAPAHGTTTVRSDGTVRYSPATGWSGPDGFAFTVTDTAGRTSAPATASIAVTPVAADDNATVAAGTPVDVPLLANDRGDFGSGAATLVADATAGSVSISPAGIATYTPAAGWSGPDSFTYRVTDSSGQTSAVATVRITVTPVGVSDSGIVDAGNSVPVDLLADDLGALDPATVTVVEQPAHGSAQLDPTTGVLTYSPAPGWSGPDSLTYRVDDLSGQHTADTPVALTVRPVATADAAGVAAGASTLVPVLGNDLGALDPATLTVTSPPGHGTATPDGAGGVTYTPDDGWSGPDAFTYSVGDGTTTVSAVVTMTVAPVVSADSATSPAGQPVDVPLLANDLGDLDPSTVLPSTPAHGTVSVDGTGLATYTPAAGWSGPDAFTYTVRDRAGQVSASAPVSISVTPLGATKSLTVAAGSSAPLAALTGLTGTFASPVPSLTTSPGHGTVAFSGTTATYAADADYSGPDAFAYTVSDTAGHLATGTVAVTVTPVAVDDSASTTAGQATTVSILGNDRGDPDAATATISTAPGHGTATVTGGVLTYTPAAGYSGPDVLIYQVRDTAGQLTSAAVHLVVQPVTAADSGSTHGEAVTLSVLANDLGSLDPTTAVVSGPPVVGTATMNPDGTVRYQPAAGWLGTDTFTYTVADHTGQVAGPATVSVTVLAPAPSAPTKTKPVPMAAKPDHQDIASGGTAMFDVLALNGITNRTGWRVLLVGQPGHGTASVVDGVVRYTPAAGYSGVDQVRYTLVSPKGQKATATLSITVAGTSPTDSGHGALPFTGLELPALLSTAALLLVAGTGFVLIGRRRRPRHS